MSGNDTDHHKVPIWIGTDCKLVTGISKSTTCQHIIQSLVRTENPSKFVIVEKWKKMERKLDPTVRILKVWKAWGDQKDDVALILRHHHSTDGYIDKRISNKVLRRNKSSQHHKLSNHDEKMEEVEVTEPMERLLKLVLTQGETIQAQLKKLRHQEEQIERYEEQMHRLRSLQEGENYVVDSYLRDDKGKKIRKRDKSPRKSGWFKQQQQKDQSKQTHHHQQSKSSNFHSSNGESKGNNNGGGGTTNNTVIGSCQSETIVQTRLEKGDENGRNTNINNNSNNNSRTAEDVEEEDEATTTTAVDIHEQNELMERICDLNKKLTKEEEHLVKLGLKIKKFYEKHKDCDSRMDAGGGGVVGGDGTLEENHHERNKKKAEQEQQEQQQYLSEQSQKEEEEEELRQLMSQLEALRDVTNEQFSEIEMNEKSLNEMEQLLDVKHDHVAHLTYQIQLVDEESEQLRQRLLKISQGFPQNSYHQPHQPHSLHPQQYPPPQYSSAIPNSSYYPYPSNQYPLQQYEQQPQQQQLPQQQQYQEELLENSIPPVAGTLANNATNTLLPVAGTGIGGESDEIPPAITSHYHHIHHPQFPQQHTQDILTQHHHQQLVVPHNQQPLVSSSSNSDMVSNISLGCQQVENISSTTTLNLHIKPCRDHQDNDSNSDTGISSLHSSSDENTLFVLDTLV